MSVGARRIGSSRKAFPMVEVIERNVLRIGRKVAVVMVFAATIHVLLAPYYYVRGLIEWNNPVSDFWVFTYTFQNLSSFVWLSVSPVLLLIGLYEFFRFAFLLMKNAVVLGVKKLSPNN